MCCRGEAVQVPVAGVRVAVRTVRRTHTPLPQAYRRQTLPLRHLRALLRAQRSPRATHEAAPAQGAQVSCHTSLPPTPRPLHKSVVLWSETLCDFIGDVHEVREVLRSLTFTPPLLFLWVWVRFFLLPPSPTPYLSKIISLSRNVFYIFLNRYMSLSEISVTSINHKGYLLNSWH